MADLESILLRLMVPDNAVIQQATAELRQAFKNPAIVPSLITVLSSSQNPQVRQYAAVLLRRRVVKHWSKLPAETHQILKNSLLQVLVQEPIPLVMHSAAQVVSVIARHDLPADQWPELLQFLNTYTKSTNVAHREMGMLLLSSVCESVGEQLRPHFPVLFGLFATTLMDRENKMIPFYTIQSITALVECLGTDEISLLKPLIPKIVAVIQDLLSVDEDRACEAMDIFDELVESEVGIVAPHLKSLIEFSLKISQNTEFNDSTRIKALYFVRWLASIKPKALVKQKLLVPLLRIVFPIMCSPPNEDDPDEDDDDEIADVEASRPTVLASQVLDVLALHLPPETLIPPLMQIVDPALVSPNPYERKASLIALAVLAEGCADYIKTKNLQGMLETVCRALADEHEAVRNAALFALGQFSEHLQPEISQYSANILPLLFEHLAKTAAENKETIAVTRTYYALETFCENLGADILPYLPALMEKLLNAVTTSQIIHIKELGISAIGATANAANEAMLPYFPQIMTVLKTYLTEPVTKDTSILQHQAIDTLGVLARTVGAQNFLPIADECMQLGLKLITEDSDPDLRRCTYGLFASISTILKGEMNKYLQPVMKHIIDSLQSTEGFVTHYTGDNDPAFLLDDDDLSETDENDDDVAGYSVENAYLEEKEDACNALGEIAENTGSAFTAHIDECFNEVFKLVQFPHAGVRKGSVTAVGQLCCVLHLELETTGQPDRAPLQVYLDQVIPAIMALINLDKDRTVAMAALQALDAMLKTMKGAMLQGQGHFEQIIEGVKNVLQLKTRCQDHEDEEEESEQQAELDAALIEYAGDVLPSLAKAVGGKNFAPYFAAMLPMLLKKTRNNCSVADKSFAVGTIGEVTLAMETAIVPFVQHLYPVVMKAVQDEDDEVASNATYGLGLLAAYGGDAMFAEYGTILETMFNLLKTRQEPRIVDNICAGISRMIMANMSRIPMEQVFPVLLQCLPLKTDFEENETVYTCLGHLYSSNHPLVFQYLTEFLRVFAQALASPNLQKDIQSGAIQIIRDMHTKSPDEFQRVVSTLPVELVSTLSAVVT